MGNEHHLTYTPLTQQNEAHHGTSITLAKQRRDPAHTEIVMTLTSCALFSIHYSTQLGASLENWCMLLYQ